MMALAPSTVSSLMPKPTRSGGSYVVSTPTLFWRTTVMLCLSNGTILAPPFFHSIVTAAFHRAGHPGLSPSRPFPVEDHGSNLVVGYRAPLRQPSRGSVLTANPRLKGPFVA